MTNSGCNPVQNQRIMTTLFMLSPVSRLQVRTGKSPKSPLPRRNRKDQRHLTDTRNRAPEKKSRAVRLETKVSNRIEEEDNWKSERRIFLENTKMSRVGLLGPIEK